MSSPRYGPLLGLAAAGVLLVSSLVVLGSGASEARRVLRAQPGADAPDFVLSDAGGRSVSLASLRGSVVALCFRSINCPVSNEYDGRLGEFARHFGGAPRPDRPGVLIYTINVGPGLPAGSAGLPSLLDPSGEVADRYAVDVTPTFFVIDASGRIGYRGSFDDNRNEAQATEHCCENALAQILHGQPVRQPLTAPFGCSLKYQSHR